MAKSALDPRSLTEMARRPSTVPVTSRNYPDASLGNCGVKFSDASGARPAPGLTAKDGDELNPFCSPAIYGSKKQLPRCFSNIAQASAAGAKPTRTFGLRNILGRSA